MGSRDKLDEGRLYGLALALKAVQLAKAAGEDPEQAIEDEIKFRRKSGVQLPNMTRIEVMRLEKEMQIFTIHSLLAVGLMVLWEEHNFRRWALKRFQKKFETYGEALVSGSINWEDCLDCLETECGIQLDREEFFKMRINGGEP